MRFIPYNREKAVAYANYWAYRRNPQYYDFSEIGGNCTNFASQCLYTGTGVMNYTPTYGWYYTSINDRAPAWTSVEYFNRFITTNTGSGPYGENVDIADILVGDFVQLKFNGKSVFGHTPVVVSIVDKSSPAGIYIAANSYDCDCRPLSTYQNVAEYRYIHILGAREMD